MQMSLAVSMDTVAGSAGSDKNAYSELACHA